MEILARGWTKRGWAKKLEMFVLPFVYEQKESEIREYLGDLRLTDWPLWNEMSHLYGISIFCEFQIQRNSRRLDVLHMRQK